jgi:hypothetical protein
MMDMPGISIIPLPSYLKENLSDISPSYKFGG